MAVLLAVLVAAGCGGGRKPPPKGTPTPFGGLLAAIPRVAGPKPDVSGAARRRAAKLSLAEQVGQVLLVAFEGTGPKSRVFSELRGHGWGGIAIGPDNARTRDRIGRVARQADAAARRAKRVRPLVLAIADGAPAHLGSTPKQARPAAAASARAMKAVGVTLAIEPKIDVGLEAFPKPIARAAPAAVIAWKEAGVMPAPAHFPGQGSATQDPLEGPASVGQSAQDLKRRDLRPFVPALLHAPAVTVSSAAFSAYDPVTPAALTPTIVRGLLRHNLHFKGVAMTDDLSGLTAGTGGTQGQAAVAALRAGIDLVYVGDPRSRAAVYSAVLNAVRGARLPAARVRDAAAHVLDLKRRVGR